MGYRFYLGSLPKKEYNQIKNFSLKELYNFKGEEWSDDPYDKPGYVGVYDVAYNRHYELGKYIDEFDKKFLKPVFKNKETQKHFTEEQHFYIVQKEFVLELINYYTNKIKKHYESLLKPFFDEKGNAVSEFLKTKDAEISEEEMKGIYLSIDHMKHIAMEWGVGCFFGGAIPYNLEGKELVGSWLYEYSIFNLVNLYRTFDWKRNVMIYYAY